MERQMIPLNSELVFTLTLRVSPAQEIGVSSSGKRRIIPINGGEFEGPKLRGTVLPGGADWMLIRPDGVAQIDVRLTLRTEDGDLIFMKYGGFRHGPKDVMDRLARGEKVDPVEYYFRITALFETGSEKYSWLNQIITVGTGHRLPNGPVYHLYVIL
jgi:hypothetical protein